MIPDAALRDSAFISRLLHFLDFVHGSYFGNPPVSVADIVYATYTATFLRPAFILCVDQATSSVVLTIRGTRSLHDAVTDMVASPCEFMGGYVHHGIALAASWFNLNLLALLRKVLRDNPGFGLVITGHSLGGGA